LASSSGFHLPALVAGFFMRGRIGGMRFRKLRIAWSVGWGLIAVLLIVLWVRSFRTIDAIRQERVVGLFQIRSCRGTLLVAQNLEGTPFGKADGQWYVSSDDWYPEYPELEFQTTLGFAVEKNDFLMALVAPHWFLVICCGAIAALPWIRRFSLRTLLIATTLVAVALGIIAISR
jgi:hypothetical protein